MNLASMRARWGMALPAIMMIVALVVLVGGAMISLGAGSLGATKHDLSSERAVYAAEAGISAATELLYRNPAAFPATFTGALPHASYSVVLFNNSGNANMAVPGGIQIPGHTEYLLSTGTCDDGSQRQSAALFRSGLGTFQVGALANNFSSNNATFDAYNSNLEAAGWNSNTPDPNSVMGNAGIMASNQNLGIDFNLGNSTVAGGLFVGVGGNPNSQVSANNSSIGRASVLADPIPYPSVTIPAVAQGSPNPAATPAPSPPAATTWTDPDTDGPLTINPPAAPGGNVTLTHFCLTLYIAPNGDYYATEGGSGSTAQGNILTGTFSQNPGGNFTVTSFTPDFNIHGYYHSLDYDPGTGVLGAEPGPITAHPGDVEPPLDYTQGPAWLQYDMGSVPPSQENPPTLSGGSYQNVSIDGATTTLQSNSVYVISNLNVTNGGQLALTPTTTNVSIYVTGTLNLNGIDSVINQSRKAPNLRIAYTGTAPVQVSGGAAAYMTLVAPNSTIALNGYGAGFNGAAVAQSVTAVNAVFHYDLATNGVGTGVDSTALTLLARYRP